MVDCHQFLPINLQQNFVKLIVILVKMTTVLSVNFTLNIKLQIIYVNRARNLVIGIAL